MAGGCADGFVGRLDNEVRNLGVLVDELRRDEAAVTGIRCRARASGDQWQGDHKRHETHERIAAKSPEFSCISCVSWLKKAAGTRSHLSDRFPIPFNQQPFSSQPENKAEINRYARMAVSGSPTVHSRPLRITLRYNVSRSTGIRPASRIRRCSCSTVIPSGVFAPAS